MRVTIALCLFCSVLSAVERKAAPSPPEKKTETKRSETKPQQAKSWPAPGILLQAPPVIVVGQSFRGAIATGVAGAIFEGIARGIADRRAARFAAESAEEERRASIVPDTMSSVSILSKPSGAMVKFYGSPLGYTPVTTRLAPGRYSVSLSAPGYANAIYDIDVQAATPAEFALDLVPSSTNREERAQERAKEAKQTRPDDSVVTLQ